MTRTRPWWLLLVAGACLTPVGCANPPPPEAAGRVPDDALEAEMRQVPIAMYMAGSCPVCLRARAWLRAGGYRFVEHDVEVDPAAAAVVAAVSDPGTVPTFDIDGQLVVGFDPTLLRYVLRVAVERRRAAGEPHLAAQ